MKTASLLTNFDFHDTAPNAQPILVDRHSRIIRWMLKPGQEIGEHNVPDAPFYIVVLQGKGAFAGGDGKEQEFGPGSLLILEPGETHTVRALDEELVFVSFMPSVETMRPDRVGGEIGRKEK
jgi:quercetin dioxygenase-like cupin family protein